MRIIFPFASKTLQLCSNLQCKTGYFALCTVHWSCWLRVHLSFWPHRPLLPNIWHCQITGSDELSLGVVSLYVHWQLNGCVKKSLGIPGFKLLVKAHQVSFVNCELYPVPVLPHIHTHPLKACWMTRQCVFPSYRVHILSLLPRFKRAFRQDAGAVALWVLVFHGGDCSIWIDLGPCQHGPPVFQLWKVDASLCPGTY